MLKPRRDLKHQGTFFDLDCCKVDLVHKCAMQSHFCRNKKADVPLATCVLPESHFRASGLQAARYNCLPEFFGCEIDTAYFLIKNSAPLVLGSFGAPSLQLHVCVDNFVLMFWCAHMSLRAYICFCGHTDPSISLSQANHTPPRPRLCWKDVLRNGRNRWRCCSAPPPGSSCFLVWLREREFNSAACVCARLRVCTCLCVCAYLCVRA